MNEKSKTKSSPRKKIRISQIIWIKDFDKTEEPVVVKFTKAYKEHRNDTKESGKKRLKSPAIKRSSTSPKRK